VQCVQCELATQCAIGKRLGPPIQSIRGYIMHEFAVERVKDLELAHSKLFQWDTRGEVDETEPLVGLK